MSFIGGFTTFEVFEITEFWEHGISMLSNAIREFVMVMSCKINIQLSAKPIIQLFHYQENFLVHMYRLENWKSLQSEDFADESTHL